MSYLLTIYALNLAQLFRFECFQHVVPIVLHGIDEHTMLMLMVVMRCQCVTVAMISMTMPNYDGWLCVAAHFGLAQLDFIAHLWKLHNHINTIEISHKLHSIASNQFSIFVLFFPAPDIHHSIFFFFHSFALSTHAYTHIKLFFCRCRFINSFDFFGPIFDGFVRNFRTIRMPK